MRLALVLGVLFMWPSLGFADCSQRGIVFCDEDTERSYSFDFQSPIYPEDESYLERMDREDLIRALNRRGLSVEDLLDIQRGLP